MSINRRKFLTLSGAGIAGGLVLGKVNAEPAGFFASKKSKKIIYRKLGKTGIKLPVVSLGVMRVDNENLIRSAYEAGIRHFDTANSYLNGKSESILSQALKDYKRDSYVISTKISARGQDISEKELIDKFETSLQRLQTDHVDILYLHGPDKPEMVTNEKIIKLFQDFKKQGKAKFIGISVHRNIPGVIKAVVDSKAWDVILTSYHFRMEDFTAVKEAIAGAADAGIGIVAMKTMAGLYWDKEKTKKINTKAALKWVLNDQNITTAIPGCTSFDQLQDDMALLNDIKLTEQEKADLDVSKNMAGLICVGCEECVPQCPKNVPVPDLMRAYMYAYGYSDMKLAHEVVSSVPEGGLACTLCDECKVECRMGFNIKERSSDIARIKDIPADFLV